MRRRARQIGAAVATGGQHRALRTEAVDGAVLQAPGGHTPAGAFLVHDQVEREILDEELHLMLQRLLIQRVQDGVARAVGGGAGAVGRRLAVFLHVAAKRALIDAAILGAGERNAEMLQLVDRRHRFAAHILDAVLVAEPVRPLDGVVHMPAPIVLAHVAERGPDAALRRHGVRAGREYLGDASGLQPRRPHPERRPQPGAARPDHHHVIGVIDDLVGTVRRLRNRVHGPVIRKSVRASNLGRAKPQAVKAMRRIGHDAQSSAKHQRQCLVQQDGDGLPFLVYRCSPPSPPASPVAYGGTSLQPSPAAARY